MMGETKHETRAIFTAALTLNRPAERACYLDQACAGKPELRRRVDALLEAAGKAGEFLTQDALGGPLDCDASPVIEGPGTVIGHYKLLEQIGEGGFGVVFMAEQVQPIRRQVALKVVKPGMDTRQVIARFEVERQALAMMNHPNIAQVFDAGATETGRPYFVMELVHGVPLTQFCDANQLAPQERLKLFQTVCEAVQHAHQKGIIHRDLKPSNILVTLHDGKPVPKVIDFGTAKALQQPLTEKTLFTAYGKLIGTPQYMSPEQAELSGLDVDTRADIYSLGVLLYELLTGTTPFEGERLRTAAFEEMIRIIREEEPPKPSTRASTLGERAMEIAEHRQVDAALLGRTLRGDLDCIVMKALEKDRARRYETASALLEDVQRHLHHQPVVARPASQSYRFQKFVRRNRIAFATASAVALALVLGMLGTSWQALRATVAKQEAVRAEQKESAARRAAESAKALETRERQHAEAGEYAANMNLAQAAWDQNNVQRVRELLLETAAYPVRGFEWYYWQRQCHLELTTLRGHLDDVVCVAFSPDGQRIATASGDGTAKVWEAATGKEVFTLQGHSNAVVSVAFSPNGQRILTGSYDQTAKVWDASSGLELTTLRGHTGGLECATFSPDGRRIVTGAGDATARVWEAASGRELFILKGHRHWIVSASFSQDGQRIVTGTQDGTARVWEAASGRELLNFQAHSGGLGSVAFSPDGRWIVTGGHEDCTAKLWEAASGNELFTMRGHNAWLSSVAFSPDSQWIATGSRDQVAKLWEAATGKEFLTLKGHSDGISSVALSGDGQRIVTGSTDDTAKVWELASACGLLILKGHSNGPCSVAFSRDGQRIVTGSADGTARVWESASGQELLTFKGHNEGIRSVAFSPDGRRIVTGSADGMARVWEAASGRELLTLKGHRDGLRSVAFSADGERIATGSWDQTAQVWDSARGTALLTLKGHKGGIRSVAFSADDQRIVTGSADDTAKVWDAAGGRELFTLKGHSDGVRSALFSSDGGRIVTASDDGTAKVWDAANGRELLTLEGHHNAVRSVAFSANGQRIVTGSQDGTAKVWQAATGRELLTLKGQASGVYSLAISTDGQRIVIGSDKGTVEVWQAATPPQVALWEKEERAAAAHIAALERGVAEAAERERALRAQDAGAPKQWLLLAPIAFTGGHEVGASRVLDEEQISRESELRPRAGERITVGCSERVWRAVKLEDNGISFNASLGERTEWSVGYAVCYILGQTNQSGLVMRVGSDDESKVYLNGKEVYRYDLPRAFMVDQDAVTGIELNAGLNVVVFKVVNRTEGWLGSLRFTDAAGQPLKGLRVVLDPGER